MLDKRRIFLIGNIGPMSCVLEGLINDPRIELVGLCTRFPKALPLNRKIKSFIRTIFVKLKILPAIVDHDVFKEYQSPYVTAMKSEITLFDAKGIHNKEFKEELKLIAPDVILMAGFHRKIPIDVINSCKDYCLNVHPSLLPKHKGGSPIRWALYENDKITGVTLHLVTEEFDEGEIVLQKEITIDLEDNLVTLQKKADLKSVELVHGFLNLYLDGKVTSLPQPRGGSYEKSFRGSLLNIDWSITTCDEVLRLCRVLKPKFSCIFKYNGDVYHIWEAEKSEATLPKNVAYGDPVHYRGTLIIKAKDGTIRVKQYLHESKLYHDKFFIKNVLN